MGRAAVWRNGVVRDLAALRSRAQVEASVINQNGQIAGCGSVAPSEQPRHVVTWENGRIRDLGIPRSTVNGSLPLVLAINGRGQIAGESVTDVHDVGTSTSYAFVSDVKGTRMLLPLSYQSGVADINNRGQVVGWRSTTPSQDETMSQRLFVWEGGRVSYLASPARYPSCSPADINDAGDVIGVCSNRWRVRAYLWQQGKRIDLGTLASGSVGVNAMNNTGQAVGYSNDVAGTGTRHAFVWEHGKMIDLGTLGGTESEATAINERAEIIGTSTTKNGNIHAVLWTRP